eukprot:10078-Heterococcus_DN1.PRE.2
MKHTCTPITTTGRVDCGAQGTSGALTVYGFTTGSYANFKQYVATDVTLAAGNGQEYTLCIGAGSYMTYEALCISQGGCWGSGGTY